MNKINRIKKGKESCILNLKKKKFLSNARSGIKGGPDGSQCAIYNKADAG